MPALNPRQQLFVLEYLKDFNGKAAAIRAGYAPKFAKGIASENLDRAEIQAELYKRMEARHKRIELQADHVLLELRGILTSDLADAVAADTGALKKLHDMPVELRRAISSVKVKELLDDKSGEKIGTVTEIKLWSKTEAANLLGKYLKLWAENAGLNIFLPGAVEVAGDLEMTLDIKT